MLGVRTTSIRLAILAVPLVSPVPALAQGQAPTAQERQGLEEVVVTSRRRDEALLDVPVSIVSVSGDSLEQARIESVSELARLVPGFVFNEFEAGQQSTAQLRGLSSFGFQTHAPQSVGVLIDDVVLDVIGQGINQFDDIQRIEVLRGPQGTLFGRNTTGGVVHIVTNEPQDEFEAKLSAGYGSYNSVRLNGTVNVPMGDELAVRASAFMTDRDGYIENIRDGEKLNSEQQAGINAKFLFTPRETTRLIFTGTYIERERDGLTSSASGGEPVVAFGPTTSQEDLDVNQAIAGPENDKVNGIGSHPFDEQIAAFSLKWQQELGEFSLVSISSYRTWDFEFSEDAPFRTFLSPVEPLSPIRFYVPNELEGWSQEVRLSSPSTERLVYVLGAFASSTDLFERRDFLFNISDDPAPEAALLLFDLGDQDTKHTDYAVFGEADVDLTDTVTFTAGARWTRDQTEVDLVATAAPFFDPELGIGIGPLGEVYIPFLESEFPGTRSLKVSDSEWTWRTGLRWEPTADWMLYSTVARGFKGPTITALGILGRIEPEITMSYELGTKLSVLDNRLNANLTVFRADVDDLQTQGVDSIPTPRGGTVNSIFLTNAAEVRSEGVEFELSAAPTEQLRFDLGVAYIDAKFVNYPQAACFSGQSAEEGCSPVEPSTQDLSGRRMPLVPEWSGNAALSYEFTMPQLSTQQFVRVDYSYRGRINWDLGLAPLTESDAVGVWGLSLGISSADERLELVGYVKNVTDEFVVNDLSGGSGAIQAHLLPEYQRTWGVLVNYNMR